MTASDATAASAAEAAAEVWVVVGRLLRKLRSLDGFDEEGDLSAAQASVLSRLVKRGPSSASELAGAENVRPQSTAKIIAVLEGAGLVERSPDPQDGRRQVVSVTPLGREYWEGGRRARQAWLARTLQEYGTEQEVQALITAMALLDRVADA
ncbi:MarR family winged helix-turn-helix transcriptional regulator [Streptomyces sp. NPDC091272]|uniref:MarR family winged helix-turn-helix transcriptional regulator n=1 Tax=Streptomyces sp. NPDC091272 TaxID=3365981 RepID=UPI0037F36766